MGGIRRRNDGEGKWEREREELRKGRDGEGKGREETSDKREGERERGIHVCS